MKVDLVILGSGFGGSLCALIGRQIGLDVALVDRAAHPRFTIGESSTPAADMILRRLADRYDLPRLAPLASWGSWQRSYPDVLGGKKRGFSYFRHAPAFTPRGDHDGELLVTASASDEVSDAHWYRPDVDAFFAREVRQAGIPFFEGVAAVPRRTHAGWRLDALDLEASFAIDATGASGAVAVAAGAGRAPDRLSVRTRALYAHFDGVPRWREVAADLGARVGDYPFDPDASAVHHVVEGGWMWMLRFADDRVSAGWVLDLDGHPADPDEPPEAEWRRRLQPYPTLARLFADASPRAMPGRIVGTPRLQRRVVRAAGQDWALLPHVAGFVDPLHSTGIAHTLSGVERIMGAFEASRSGSERSDAMEAYGSAVLQEIDHIDRLVRPCYRATESWPLWRAATMLYFAAATYWERSPKRSFLLADDEAFVEITKDAGRILEAEPESFPAWLEAALEPYNCSGLFRPSVPNMYAYTAAPKGGGGSEPQSDAKGEGRSVEPDGGVDT